MRCWFYERRAVAGGWQYTRLDLGQHPDWATPHPPVIGDLVSTSAGLFRVAERMWMYPQQGSMDWPHGEDRPLQGPIVQYVMDAAEGPFVDEVNAEDEP